MGASAVRGSGGRDAREPLREGRWLSTGATRVLGRLLRPGAVVTAALVVASVVGDVWCLLGPGGSSPLAPAIYALSTYALVVVVTAVVDWGPRAVDAVRGWAPVRVLMGSEGIRVGISSARSLVLDFAYAAFVLATGLQYDSGWALAVALYNLVTALLGFAVAFGLHRARRADAASRMRGELNATLACGVLLVVLAFVLSGVMVEMIARRKADLYGTVAVIAIATFTFVSLVLSIKSLAQVRRVERPLLVASRAVSFSEAVVKLFFLETTMIAVFGADQESFRFVMEAVSGAVCFALVMIAAVALIVYSARGLRAHRP